MSPRKLSRISDINEFFDVLYRLELGSINNQIAFHRIVDHLNDPDLHDLLRRTSNLSVPDPFNSRIGTNLYAYRRAKGIKELAPEYLSNKEFDEPAPQADPGPSRTSLSSHPNPLQTRAFDILSCDIGKRWRDLGRCLGFHEADLEEIESRHCFNLREKIHAMLQEFGSNRHSGSEEDLLNSLCAALDQCRRIDLRKRIQQLLPPRSTRS